MDDGVIGGFGLAVPALHGSGWTHYSWFGMSDLSAMDHVQAALGEAIDGDLERQIASTFDESQHTDTLYRVLHVAGPSGE